MRKKVKFIILSWLAIFYSCTSQTSETEVSTNNEFSLHLNINNLSSETNRIYYLDEFNNLSFLKEGPNDILCDDDFLQIIDGKFKISFFVKKADSIRIESNNEYIRLISSDSCQTKAFEFSNVLFDTFEKETFDLWNFQKAKLDKKYTVQPSLREKEFNEELAQQVSFLQDYQKKHGLSQEFLDFQKKIIQYKNLEKRLILGINDIKFQKKYALEVIEESKYIASETGLSFFNSFRNSLFTRFYLQEKFVTPTLNNKLGYFSNEYSKENLSLILLNSLLIEKFDKQGSLDNQMKIDSVETIFLKICKTEKYLDYYRLFSTLDNKTFGDNELLSAELTPIDFNKILKGEINYVDFWASWCGPCRAEMPYSQDLKNKYQNEDVSFCYISMDKNPAAWQKASHSIGLLESNTFLLPQGKDSQIGKHFNIQEIPRYVILSRTGEILLNNAPRPSDPNLPAVFDELLELKKD